MTSEQRVTRTCRAARIKCRHGRTQATRATLLCENRRIRWATVVLVGLALAYPLSWGPAAWLCSLIGDPEWATETYWFVYDPLFDLTARCPKAIRQAAYWYVMGLNPWRLGRR